MIKGNVDLLKEILDKSQYTVAICGSGMLAEMGFITVKTPERAYEIEKKYGVSPEYLFTSVYYNTRSDKFFEFYKNEMLNINLEPTPSSYILAAMERAGKLQCVITSNIYENPQKAGCHNVINLHGSVYQNKCPKCGRMYSLDYIKFSKRVPLCETCNTMIRPLVSLFGETLDSQLMTRTTQEIEKADVLLVLGTTLDSEVFSNYIKYFNGSRIVIIHKNSHYSDEKADIVFCDEPKNILTQLGY